VPRGRILDRDGTVLVDNRVSIVVTVDRVRFAELEDDQRTEMLERLAPYRDDYKHHATGETNSDAHLKSLLVHHEVIVPVTDSKLDLGPWQQVYYAEFDGRRRKRVIVKVMGE